VKDIKLNKYYKEYEAKQVFRSLNKRNIQKI